MTTIIADVETTTWSKGSPFDTRNKLVCIGLQDLASDEVFVYYEENFELARQKLKEATRIIGFNLKFDPHWLRKYGMLPDDLRDVWDCQLFEFMLSKQRWRYPSLEETVVRRFNEHKVDVVKEQYWEQGINTDEIPRDVLTIYTDQDIRLTTKTYLAQQDEIVDWYKLFRVHCADLLVLEEMEWNGLYLDVNQSEERAEHDLGIIEDIEKKLRAGYESVPINFDSTDHLSAYLYGGAIVS